MFISELPWLNNMGMPWLNDLGIPSSLDNKDTMIGLLLGKASGMFSDKGADMTFEGEFDKACSLRIVFAN